MDRESAGARLKGRHLAGCKAMSAQGGARHAGQLGACRRQRVNRMAIGVARCCLRSCALTFAQRRGYGG